MPHNAHLKRPTWVQQPRMAMGSAACTALAAALQVSPCDVEPYIALGTVDAEALLGSRVFARRAAYTLAWADLLGCVPPPTDTAWRTVDDAAAFVSTVMGRPGLAAVVSCAARTSDPATAASTAYTRAQQAVSTSVRSTYAALLQAAWGCYASAGNHTMLSAFLETVRLHLGDHNANWRMALEASRMLGAASTRAHCSLSLVSAAGSVALILDCHLQQYAVEGAVRAAISAVQNKKRLLLFCDDPCVKEAALRVTVEQCARPCIELPRRAWYAQPRHLFKAAIEVCSAVTHGGVAVTSVGKTPLMFAQLDAAVGDRPMQQLLNSAELVEALCKLAINNGDNASQAAFWSQTSRLWCRLACSETAAACITAFAPGRERAVLLIDSRPNPLTAAAALTCAAQLDGHKWSLHIVTTPGKAADYYSAVLACCNVTIHTGLLPAWARQSLTVDEYNDLLKSSCMWSELLHAHSVRRVLLAQDDGFLIRDACVSEFGGGLEGLDAYRFVGAPWATSQPMLQTRVGPDLVGNGGLSVRCVESALAVTHAHGPCGSGRLARDIWFDGLQQVPEDVHFVQLLQECHGRSAVAPRGVASRFAAEQVPVRNCLGVHKPWPYMDAASVSQLFTG